VWNASASAPIGLYRVLPENAVRGDLVLVRTPESVRQLAAERGYLPLNVPLVKRVAAADGDIVCAADDAISVNGRVVAERLARDRLGRPLPRWSGCLLLDVGETFLLMEGVSDSFDGRYFGPVPTAAIIGRLVPLWVE
jgi:conjugative transfer signal peptidase TraF